MSESYNVAVGSRLRGIRKQKGLSLQDVEAESEQEFKASVLGAYERGERSLSLPRMQRLASFYGVPADQLLPPGDRPARGGVSSWPSSGVTIDLSRIEEADESTAGLIEQFLRSIQVMRQDFNGRVLTIRNNDLRLLAGLLGTNEDSLRSILIESEGG